MKKKKTIPKELIAPCGMNCALCSRYLAYINNLKRSHCVGCRTRNTACTYLFKKCTGINQNKKGDTEFCFKCDQFPCKQLKRMDARYRKSYGMSVFENLEKIRDLGLAQFIKEQYKEHHCSKCKGLISVHNCECFECDEITRLVEKRDKK